MFMAEDLYMDLVATCTGQVMALIGLSVLGWVIGLIIAIIFDIALNKKMNLAVKIFAPIIFTLCGGLLFFGINVEKRVNTCLESGKEVIEPLLGELLTSMTGVNDLSQDVPTLSEEEFNDVFENAMNSFKEAYPEYVDWIERIEKPLRTTFKAIVVRDEPISFGEAAGELYMTFYKSLMLVVKGFKLVLLLSTAGIFVLFLTIAILTAVLKARKEEETAATPA